MKPNGNMYKSDRIAKIYFLLQGIGTLISWNAVLNGLDYFAGSYPQYNTDFLLPISVNGAQVVANFFIPFVGSMIALRYRVIIPLMVLSSVLIFLPIGANLMHGSSLGFWLIMTMLFVLGFFNNIYQGSVSGFAGQFPGKYTSYFLMGTGLAGLLMNILRALAIVSFAGMPGGALTEIVVYFSIAGLILITCMLIHPIFTKSQFCKYYLGNIETNTSTNDERSEELIPQETAPESHQNDLRTVLSVFRQVWFFVMLLLFNYMVGFLTFPGVMFEKPIHSMGQDWKIVSMLAAFNACDIIGKNIAQYRHLYTKWTILGVVLSRLVLDAFFIIQAITSNIAVFNTVWFSYLNIALFGLTNGFVTTALFILGPEKVEGKKKEIAGFLSIVGLTTGITLGGFLALPLANLNANNS